MKQIENIQLFIAASLERAMPSIFDVKKEAYGRYRLLIEHTIKVAVLSEQFEIYERNNNSWLKSITNIATDLSRKNEKTSTKTYASLDMIKSWIGSETVTTQVLLDNFANWCGGKHDNDSYHDSIKTLLKRSDIQTDIKNLLDDVCLVVARKMNASDFVEKYAN